MPLFNFFKIVTKTTLLLFLVLLFFIQTKQVQAQEKVIYFFYGQGCPHCLVVEKYFEENNFYNKYPIDKREIYFNKENAKLFNSILDKLEYPVNQRGVPTVVIGNQVLVGDTPITNNFTQIADNYLLDTEQQNEITEENTVEQDLQVTPTKADITNIKSAENTLTLLAVISASLVDAINPCAFAVLILLMTTILIAGDRKKALKSGLSFAASIFISYFLMGLGLYKALQISNASNIFFNIVGWLAIILGLLNLKDAVWYGKGVLMEVPLSWRPKLKKTISSVTSPIGAFLIGFVVSLFLLPCTSGPYIVILGMLAEKVNLVRAIFYLLLYNLVFVLPMVLITLGVYKGFDIKKAEKARTKHLRTLHLIAGIILIIMGVIVLRGF